MIRKVFAVLVVLINGLLFSMDAKSQSNSDMNGGFFQIGINYFQPTKPGLAGYLKDFSDSLHFPRAFSFDKGYGITLAFISHHNAFEFSGGGDVMWQHDYQNIGDTLSGSVNTTDINLNFGLNYLPVRWFFVGGSFSICNGSEKFKPVNGATNVILESQGDGFSNIFNGYSIGVKAQAGFNINLSKKDEYNTYLRLSAFYEAGLTKYDFYKTFEHRMKNFSGNRKTNLTYPGISLSLQFSAS